MHLRHIVTRAHAPGTSPHTQTQHAALTQHSKQRRMWRKRGGTKLVAEVQGTIEAHLCDNSLGHEGGLAIACVLLEATQLYSPGGNPAALSMRQASCSLQEATQLYCPRGNPAALSMRQPTCQPVTPSLVLQTGGQLFETGATPSPSRRRKKLPPSSPMA